MKDSILVPNAPLLVESTRSVGYSFQSALSDIIDNSISKNASNIDILFDSNYPQYIAVIDNGQGMSNEELVNAMRYGSKDSLEQRDASDLGRFGLGLKTASMSQCRKMTVITKQHGVRNAAQWDLDHIIEVNDWALRRFDEEETAALKFANELDNCESGTVVVWEVFDRMLGGAADQCKVFDEKMELARQHVALVFHRFLGDEMGVHRLKITFNGLKVMPIDPFLSDHRGTQPLTEHTLKLENDYIRVKPFILPHPSKLSEKDKKYLGDMGDLKSNQGFYVYRNKRLIIWGTWFRLVKQMELNKLARVRIDIPNSLDELWKIDIKKSTASLPDVIKKNLADIVYKSIGRSERVYQHRGRKVCNDDMQHIWEMIENRGQFQFKINRDTPIFRHIEHCIDENNIRYLRSFITLLEESFPYEDVYYRMAKGKNNAKAEKLDFEKIYDLGVDYIEAYKKIPDSDISNFLATLDKIDLFSKYPEVISKLREEYGK